MIKLDKKCPVFCPRALANGDPRDDDICEACLMNPGNDIWSNCPVVSGNDNMCFLDGGEELKCCEYCLVRQHWKDFKDDNHIQ